MAPKYKKIDSAFFTPISKDERERAVEREFASLNTRLELEEALAKEEVVKRPVGRPKKDKETVLHHPNLEPMKKSRSKVRRKYFNWFTPQLWPPIFRVVQQHRSIGDAWNFLRSAYRLPGDLSNVYDHLSRGTMYGWFHTNGTLKDNIQRCVELGTYFTKSAQHCPILDKFPLLKEEICQALNKQRTAGQPLYASYIQGLIKAIISKRDPELLKTFTVSEKWTREFLKCELNWSYRAATTAVGKLPIDYEEQGRKMAQRCAFLVRVYNIPEGLIVNTDQTSIHLVPTGGARTWEVKNSKQVMVHRVEDKRQITVAASSAANGKVLPFQVIFQGLTSRSLPPLNDGRIACEESGWHVTFTSNHWSSLDTCKDFVDKILSSYRKAQIEELGLPNHQEMIWLIDCWSMHISQEFRAWMKSKNPQIHLLFIPANCTLVFQPADVILQRPFKHAF
jgi:hypothetical protein